MLIAGGEPLVRADDLFALWQKIIHQSFFLFLQMEF
jgi:hypothetical protein